MDPDLQKLKDEIEEQIDGILDALEVSREEVRAETETIRLAMHTALARHALGEPGQLEHLKRLAKEIPSTLAIPTLVASAEAKRRVFGVIGRTIDALFSVAARLLGPAVVLALALMLPGCAWLIGPTKVPGPLIQGVVENVCDVVDDCVAAGKLPADAPACENTEGTFYAEAHGKTINGALVGTGAAEVCGLIEQCLAAPQSPFPSNQAADYRRWCGRLQGISQAALAAGG